MAPRVPPTGPGRRERTAAFLGITSSTAAVSAAMFLMGLGEQLWRRFLPKYLEQLGAPVTAIGLFGTAEDLLDGLYQYPGGWVADHYGRRRALLLFVSLATVGYGVYWAMPVWPLAFVGLVFSMAWTSMASPTLFAVVGDALPRAKRTMGFTVQAILRRVPIVVAPTLGGLAIAAFGLTRGMRLGLVASMAMALLTLTVVTRIQIPVAPDPTPTGIRDVWASFPVPLRLLLFSDVFIRVCEAMVDIFLVLYAVNVLKIGAPHFGLLIAIQALTSMLVYIPAARIAERTGKKPFVVATFTCFTLFPLAVVLSPTYGWLVVAFIIGGLREVGEPARKALIVDLAPPAARGRAVGLYYLARSLAIAPSAFVGGLLWRLSAAVPFYVAAVSGATGTLLFMRTVDEEHAA